MTSGTLEFNIEAGVEHRVSGGSLIPLGGQLPYYLEMQTSKLLDVLVGIAFTIQRTDQNLRQRINRYLYSRTRPGFYLEINEHLHLAYADQRNGHGTQHWWRLFFDNDYRHQIEQLIRGTAITVSGEHTSSNDNRTSEQEHARANAPREWGGMYFRSAAEIKIAEELDKQEILFFANSRGRVGRQGSPVSDASGWLTGRVEVDFLVFYKRKCIILEVDGQHHQESLQTSRDYLRDRVLLREGIPTVRFTAKECFERAADVVTEFLNIF
ncbi:DUF2726 domain-containing protein [Iningainema tapete]|uniref:DUF559 domain-containing protein n=1 Tax=Iningainema tapete BLCC-T55 TaxID=2748662 RepID=A0A8J6XGL1_9CYAN|nr:DUF559 domain-containing protein [Iningainema tapete]MBD2771394.1 DUF559 domain-containing protein [Iningainema tapete BLCC-T55]